MAFTLNVILVLALLGCVESLRSHFVQWKTGNKLSRATSIARILHTKTYIAPKDELGYEIKDRKWFEGLSLEMGGR
jgi:hypothetical protein